MHFCPIPVLIGLVTTITKGAQFSYTLPDNRPDLQQLHDNRQYQEIHDFIDMAGAFVLEDYYLTGLINRQTLFNIAALTGFIDVFYMYSRVGTQEQTSRSELMTAMRYAQSEDPMTFRMIRANLRCLSDAEWEIINRDLFSTTENMP